MQHALEAIKSKLPLTTGEGHLSLTQLLNVLSQKPDLADSILTINIQLTVRQGIQDSSEQSDQLMVEPNTKK